MVPALHFASLAAALLSSAQIPPAEQPGQAELEAALRAYYVRLAAHPEACRKGVGCLKPPKAIKVRNYDCQRTGTDKAGGAILFCRVTYVHKGGSLAHVTSPNECVPLRRTTAPVDDGGTRFAWEFAMIESKGQCPGGRE